MLQRKSDVFQKFKEYEAEVTNFTGNRIKALRTDNGGEYKSVQCEAYLKSKGIRHETTTPFTPQQNGVSERLNRTLQEMALSQVQHAGLPREFWAESVSTACYVRNRLPVTSVGVSPFERWYGRKPTVKHLRVFGCTAFALKPNPYRRKMEAKSEQMRFVGYQKGTKGYPLYDEKNKCLVIRRDVVYKEVNCKGDEIIVTPVDAESSDMTKIGKDVYDPDLQSDAQDDVLEAEINNGDADKRDDSATTTRSGRVSRKPRCLGDWAGDKELEFLDLIADSSAVQQCLFFHGICEPQSIEEALETPEATHWKQAADEEMEALNKVNTWKLVELPEGQKPVGCRWIFTVKTDNNGSIERYKARLVAKGYAQEPGIDFNEPFAPVVRLNTLRALLAYSVQNNVMIHQMDVTTAFLNGSLAEEVYMEQPPGYIVLEKKHLVCYLQRSLYGLKQSPRCWNIKFCELMEQIGFQQLKSDCCVFTRDDPLTFVSLYVDDLVLIMENSETMDELKLMFMKHFIMKDMGPLHYILGIGCIQEESRIGLTQNAYIEKLVDKYGLTEAKPVSTPSDPNVTLQKDDGFSKPVNKKMFQSLVGSLLYAALATRPDVQYAVSNGAKYSAAPTQAHWNAAKRVLRYLKGTKNFALWCEEITELNLTLLSIVERT